MFVLDVSAALAIALPSQASEAADALFSRRPFPELTAPAIFRLELRNVLGRFERRGELTTDQADEIGGLIESLVVLRPASDLDTRFMSALALARTERLSIFDAFYLDLAIAENAVLVSRDNPLLAAAQRCGRGVEGL